jgi:hypothetical protein
VHTDEVSVRRRIEPERFANRKKRMADMSIDDLLMAIIIAGLGLSGACLKADYLSWRRENAAHRGKQASLREVPPKDKVQG